MMEKILRKTIFLLVFFIPVLVHSQTSENDDVCTDKLFVLWTSDDVNLAERMVLMYAHTAKTSGWYEEVTLIIWGPSAKLTSENASIKNKLMSMQDDGVKIEACIVCADGYEVTDILQEMGFDVKPMGKPLTEYMKSGAKLLTF